MESRPIIEIKPTSADRLIDLLGWLMLATCWTLVFWSYGRLPHTIPSHFDASGEINGWSSRNTLFLLPLIGTVLFIGLRYLNKFPHKFNYLTRITESNALAQYTAATRMIRWLNLTILMVFALITWAMIQSAYSTSTGGNSWLMPTSLVLIHLPIVYFIYKSVQSKRVG